MTELKNTLRTWWKHLLGALVFYLVIAELGFALGLEWIKYIAIVPFMFFGQKAIDQFGKERWGVR